MPPTPPDTRWYRNRHTILFQPNESRKKTFISQWTTEERGHLQKAFNYERVKNGNAAWENVSSCQQSKNRVRTLTKVANRSWNFHRLSAPPLNSTDSANPSTATIFAWRRYERKTGEPNKPRRRDLKRVHRSNRYGRQTRRRSGKA